ncbi:MAG: DUF1573 domain-containing protein [Clostridiales bacterium]|nr:DUF1573 domain-containing protein [Clostridiales bacterium]
MKDLLWDEFQESVNENLVHNRSILDVLSKLHDSTSRVHRAIVKAVTSCGCIQIHAEKPRLPDNISLRDLKHYMDDHIQGQLCSNCREVVEEELGRILFYMAALGNAVDVNIYDVLIREQKKLSTLGIYHIS